MEDNKDTLKSSRIGALPDVVLQHILSCLDMKEVVQTSLLSSRWRYLWVSLPVINCNHLLWRKENYHMFMNLIDKVLLLRDGSDIRKFKICCSQYYDTERLDSWITSAARKHLQEMHLQLYPVRPLEFPRTLFCSAISVLKLDFTYAGNNALHIEIPNLICSSTRLTTLELIFVKLPEGNSSGELLFSYPVLENLAMIECRHEHLKVLNISTPQLKTFLIQNELDPKPEIEGSCHIELCAPNLQSLEASCNLYENYRRGICFENFCMKSLSSLFSAKFHFIYVYAKSMVKLLEGISCAKTIELSGQKFEDLSYFSNELTSSFSNLRCLKLTVEELELSCITFLLMRLPYIETLVLQVEDSDFGEDLFAYVNYHLKDVEIGWLTGSQDDYECLQSLLKNALVLEKLVIRMHYDSPRRVKETFGKKILPLLRPSSSVAVFYFS